MKSKMIKFWFWLVLCSLARTIIDLVFRSLIVRSSTKAIVENAAYAVKTGVYYTPCMCVCVCARLSINMHSIMVLRVHGKKVRICLVDRIDDVNIHTHNKYLEWCKTNAQRPITRNDKCEDCGIYVLSGTYPLLAHAGRGLIWINMHTRARTSVLRK